MIYIGIDPGVSGGLAGIYPDGRVKTAFKMPETMRALSSSFQAFDSANGTLTARAALEHVHSSPQMGVVSAFTFGQNYGALLMLLEWELVSFDEVTPAKWQRALGCLSKGDKAVTKRRAEQLFPALRITHAIADALLLAEYCRRLHRGML